MHLLKWQYQSTYRSKSWRITIRIQRRDVNKVLKANPSLKPKLSEIGEEAYIDAIDMAALETGLDETTFPPTFEQTGWSWEQVLDMEYLP